MSTAAAAARRQWMPLMPISLQEISERLCVSKTAAAGDRRRRMFSAVLMSTAVDQLHAASCWWTSRSPTSTCLSGMSAEPRRTPFWSTTSRSGMSVKHRCRPGRTSETGGGTGCHCNPTVTRHPLPACRWRRKLDVAVLQIRTRRPSTAVIDNRR